MTTQQDTAIEHFVVHIMNKEQRENAALDPAREEKPSREATQKLVSDILKRYQSRGGKGFGKFEEDTDNFPMGNIISDYYASAHVDFFDTSIRMFRHLASRANAAPLSTGGIVLFAHLIDQEKHKLLVAILTSTLGSTITDHDVEPSEYLDISKLRVAGIIDLTGFASGEDRYISFMKGQHNVAEYFKLFLGCNDVFLAKQETIKLKKALEDFTLDKRLEAEQKENFFNQAFSSLKELSSNQNGFNVEVFSNQLWPTAPEELQEKILSPEYGISDGFIPDNAVINDLVTFKGKAKNWSVKFTRQALNDGSVIYDKDNNRLILKNLPDSLIADMDNEHKEEEDED